MDSKAKLVASAVTICAALVILSLQGCLSEISTAPPSSIGDESRTDEESSEKNIRRQPTILRAEVAVPPVPEMPDERPSSYGASDFRFANDVMPVRGNPAGYPAPNPHIADLLPIPSLDAPPLNQR
jgi:hypothetical protein